MQNVNRELVEIRRSFSKYYQENLKNNYQNLETCRQKNLHRLYKRFAVFITIGLIAYFICVTCGISLKQALQNDIIFPLFLIYLVIFYASCSIPFSDYKRQTKSLVMAKILAFFGKFRYQLSQTPITSALIRQSELFDTFHNQTIDDSFQGTCRETDLAVSEQHLTRTVHTRNGTREVTVFKGVFILLKFNKKFSGKTIVVDKLIQLIKNIASVVTNGIFLFFLAVSCTFIFSVFSLISWSLYVYVITFLYLIFILIYWLYHKKQKSLAPVYLEDVVFSKKWFVRGTDQIEARYLLTPALMERILHLKKLFHGNRLDFSFFNDHLLIAVHTRKDMFETTSLLTSTSRYDKVQEVISQLYSIFLVTDLVKNSLENRLKK